MTNSEIAKVAVEVFREFLEETGRAPLAGDGATHLAAEIESQLNRRRRDPSAQCTESSKPVHTNAIADGAGRTAAPRGVFGG